MPPSTRRPARTAANAPRFLGQPRSGDPAPAPAAGPEPEEPPPISARAGSAEREPSPVVGGAPPAGVRVEQLDPRIILWPEGYIESQHTDETMGSLERSMAGGERQRSAVEVMQVEEGRYIGTGGKHRCAVALRAGWPTVRCEVTPGTLREARAANLANAFNQSKPSNFSAVTGVYMLHQEGFSLEELVVESGRSPATIQDYLVIAEAHPAVLQMLQEDTIGIGVAALLARVEDLEAQGQIALDYLARPCPIDELRERIRGHGAGSQPGDAQSSDHEDPPAPRRTRRQSEPIETTALACNLCGARHEDGHQVEVLYACQECRQGFQGPAQEGRVPVPIGLLKEAEALLAGSQAGAGVAQRLAALLEG